MLATWAPRKDNPNGTQEKTPHITMVPGMVVISVLIKIKLTETHEPPYRPTGADVVSSVRGLYVLCRGLHRISCLDVYRESCVVFRAYLLPPMECVIVLLFDDSRCGVVLLWCSVVECCCNERRSGVSHCFVLQCLGFVFIIVCSMRVLSSLPQYRFVSSNRLHSILHWSSPVNSTQTHTCHDIT